MEFLLSEEVNLLSQFRALLLVSFVFSFVLYFVIRVTRKYTVKEALIAPTILFFIMFYFGYQTYTDKWFFIKVDDQTVEVHKANNNRNYIDIAKVLTIRPRFGKFNCAVIIRTTEKVYSSTEFATDRCRDLSRQLNTAISH